MGNLLMAYAEQTKVVGNIPAVELAQNVTAVPTVEASQIDGQSHIEILQQILIELKILNQQIYELPRLLSLGLPSVDEPQQFRNEPSIFNI